MSQLVAPCGIICSECDIYRAPSEPELARQIVDALARRGIETKPEQIRCTGCPGDNREEHWSADCGILQCAVDDRGFRYCSECHEFACERLEGWARDDERYASALERLRGMKMEQD